MLRLFLLLFFVSLSAGAVPILPSSGAATDIDISPELLDLQKKQLAELEKQTQAYIEQTAQTLAQAKKYQQSIKSAPLATEQLKKRLDKLKQSVLPEENVLLAQDLDNLNQQLLSKKSELLNLQGQADGNLQQLSTMQNALPEINQTLLQQQTQLEQLTLDLKELKNTPADAELDGASVSEFEQQLKQAQQAALVAESKLVDANIKTLRQRSLSHEHRLTLLKTKNAVFKQRITLLTEGVDLYQKIINKKQEEAALKIAEAIEKEQQVSHDKTQLEQQAIAQNHSLSEQLSQLSQQISQATQEKTRQQLYFQQLQDDFDNLQQQVEIAGLNENLADVLHQQKKKLPTITTYQENNVDIWQEKLVTARLAQFKLTHEQQDLSDIPSLAKKLVRQAKINKAQFDIPKVTENLSKILEARQDLFNQINDLYTQYIQLLYALESERQQLWQQSEKYVKLLDEKLFWVPNLRPIDWQWPTLFYQDQHPFGSYQQWQQLGQDFIPTMMQSPVLFWGWFMLFISSLVFRRMIYRALIDQTKYVQKVLRDNFMYTVKALFYSLLLALPWVLLLNGFAWVLLHIEDEQHFSHALGDAFFYVGTVFFLVEFLRFLCVEKGVFHGHFLWSKDYCDTLYKNLTWFQVLIFPLLFIVTLTQSQSYIVDNILVQETWGRLALISSSVAIFFFLFFIFKRHLSERWWLWPILLIATILPIVLAVDGYYYTSLNIGIRLFHSTGFVAAALLLYYFIGRWTMIIERKLAFQQALAHQRKLYADSQDKEARPSFKLDYDAIQMPEINLNSISEQTRAFLRLFIFTFLAVGLWFTWADIFPVLGFLDNLVLWETSSVINGVKQVLPVTLYDVATTLLALIITVAAAWNLPGMLELLLLQRLALKADKRYTIATITKYIIIVTGILSAAHSLGLRWSQVQWLAAALSVGLGFGLQEIFANFVSGLIILFERPIRIGDMVTVGEVNGEVTSIHMRTTIITDRDNKELIVPNKSFITNELINWTLSDPNIRVTIHVSVAYGTDVELVEKLLFDLAKEEPLALPSYTPRVFFLRFGESSLDFEIRVHVSEYPHQNLIRHRLNKKIEKTFEQHNIEIPFPQRDLHVYNHNAGENIAPSML